MKIFKDLNLWRQTRQTVPGHQSIGFVPTMGNLHIGHASLYERSIADNACTIASLFVNPTQFNQSDDFTNYPRTLENDLALLESLGVDYCILPDKESLYQDGYRYQVQETSLSHSLEGEHRPGHFTGVLTVVMKLLNLAKPNKAYFGEKDYQQFQLIRDMASAFFMDVDIIPCPTIREESGLAFSSRNNRLLPEQRPLADAFADIFLKTKQIDEMRRKLDALGVEIEYIEEQDNRRFAAVKIGDIRLIDNYSL